MVQKWLKWSKNGSKTVQKWFKAGPKMVQKWFENGPKVDYQVDPSAKGFYIITHMSEKWSINGPKRFQKWF